jgi:hypothetical protein
MGTTPPSNIVPGFPDDAELVAPGPEPDPELTEPPPLPEPPVDMPWSPPLLQAANEAAVRKTASSGKSVGQLRLREAAERMK